MARFVTFVTLAGAALLVGAEFGRGAAAGGDDRLTLTRQVGTVAVEEGGVGRNRGTYYHSAGQRIELTVSAGDLVLTPPAPASGFFFVNDLPPFGSDTFDVDLGDLDGDGDLDAFVSCSPGPHRVWLNDGQGRFTPGPPMSLGVTGVSLVELADIDADGDLDAFLWKQPEESRIEIWGNDGDAGFVLASNYSISEIDHIDLGDLDGDGDLDLFLSRDFGNGSLRYLGQDLQFQLVEPVIGNHRAGAQALGDLDGDGDLDVVIGARNAAASLILLQQGSDYVTRPLATFPETVNAIALGDLDADGDLDLVVDLEGREAWILVNDGTAAFAKAGVIYTDGPRGVDLHDLDLDGDLDVLLEDRVFFNDGAGGLTDSDQPSIDARRPALATITSFPPRIGDIDGDGLPDLLERSRDPRIWLNGQRIGQWSWQLATTDGPANESVTLTATAGTTAPAVVSWSVSVANVAPTVLAAPDATVVDTVATIDLGGFVDPGDDGPWQVTVSWGDGTEDQWSVGAAGELGPRDHVFPGPGDYDVHITVAENGDGQGSDTLVARVAPVGVDVVVLGPARVVSAEGEVATQLGVLFAESAQEIGLQPSTGEIERVAAPLFDAAYRPTGQRAADEHTPPGVGDLDGDGDLDVVWFDYPRTRIWLNAGDGTFAATNQSLPHSWPEGGRLADLDGDGDIDVVGYVQPELFALDNDGQGAFVPRPLAELPRLEGLNVGDLDGDGDVDVVASYPSASGPNSPSVVLFNRGDGTFRNSFGPLAQGLGVELGDLDRDGDLDAFVWGDRYSFVCPNRGDGYFAECSHGPACPDPDGTTAAALGDLDGDGDLDAFLGCPAYAAPWNTNPPPTGRDRVYLNEGDGTFVDSGQSLALGTTRSVALGDLDGDGDLDAWVDAPSSTVWVNDGQARFQDAGIFVPPARAVLADLDGDGVLDALADGVWLSREPDAAWSWSWPIDDGPLLVDVTIEATLGGEVLSTATFEVEATNLPPSFALRADDVADCGIPLTFTAYDARDPSAVDERAGFTFHFEARQDLARPPLEIVVPPQRPPRAEVTVEVPLGFLVDHRVLRVTATATDKDQGQFLASVLVGDATPPAGSILSPASGACLGGADVPVFVEHDFRDACTPPLLLEPIFTPPSPGHGPYVQDGDYAVSVRVQDRSGNRTVDEVAFTIDTVRPTVSFVEPSSDVAFPADLPLTVRVTSADEDAASGDVVHESLQLGGCVLFDGAGSGSGQLTSTELTLTRALVCDAVRACGLATGPVRLRFTATDCAGNRGFAGLRVDLDAEAACRR